MLFLKFYRENNNHEPTDVGGGVVLCGGVWGIKKGRSALPSVVIGVRVFDFCAEGI